MGAEAPAGRARVFLMGLRASGKSRLGAALAALRRVEFFDTDASVELRTGRSPAAWIREEGIARFRQVEAEAVAALLSDVPVGAVVALGGGSLEAPGVFSRLRVAREDGCWRGVWLRPRLESLACALRAGAPGPERPPLTDLPPEQELRHLALRRSPRFARLSDLVFATDDAEGRILASDSLVPSAEDLERRLRALSS